MGRQASRAETDHDHKWEGERLSTDRNWVSADSWATTDHYHEWEGERLSTDGNWVSADKGSFLLPATPTLPPYVSPSGHPPHSRRDEVWTNRLYNQW